MRFPRIYLDQDLGKALKERTAITFDDNAQRYVAQVLRLKPGTRITLFNGKGGEYRATLEQVSRRKVTACLDNFEDRTIESALDITLAQGISRGERMDFTLQKATELGVRRIAPLVTERCGVHLNDERRSKRIQHWQGVITAACQQSGRNTLPIIEPITPLTQWLPRDPAGPSLRLVLDPGADHSIKSLPPPTAGIELLIGPEGGLEDSEIEMARRNGYQAVAVGPRILRTETAGVAVLAIIQTLWGDI